MKAKLSIKILAEVAKRAKELDTTVSYFFDDFTNVIEYED